jgi:hypothetical protein
VNAKRITEITVETVETFSIRQSRPSTEFHCSQCGSAALVLPQHPAAGWFLTRLREICEGAGTKHIHVAKTADGSTIVCLDSLRKAAPHLLDNSSQQINETKENAS